MAGQIVLRDVAWIILPFCIFIGLFGHGALSAAGYAFAVLCFACEIRYGQRKLAPVTNGLEGA
jgi:hypothetical protein